MGEAPTHPTPPHPGALSTTSIDDAARDAYGRFGRRAALTLCVASALGFLPTQRLAGDPGLVAMILALVADLLASAAGTVPMWRVRHGQPTDLVTAQMAAMALRLATVLLLGTAIALTGLVPLPAFLLWLAIGHAALLVTDTLFAQSIAKIVAAQVPASTAPTSKSESDAE